MFKERQWGLDGISKSAIYTTDLNELRKDFEIPLSPNAGLWTTSHTYFFINSCINSQYMLVESALKLGRIFWNQLGNSLQMA